MYRVEAPGSTWVQHVNAQRPLHVVRTGKEKKENKKIKFTDSSSSRAS